MKQIIPVIIFLVISVCGFCAADNNVRTADPNGTEKTCGKVAQTEEPLSQRLTEILGALGKQSSEISSYKGRVEYLFIQEPDILDSRTLRKGLLCYKKDKLASRLRVNFETLKQDDSDERKYSEQFIFDGLWLTKIDYQLKKVDFYQQAEEGKPLDVFEFISHHFPILGFTKPQTLTKEFQISIVQDVRPDEPKAIIQLKLKVRKDSSYRDNYSVIDFWIDAKSMLPVKVMAWSPQGDIYDIKFTDTSVNKKLDDAVFKIAVPADFENNSHPLALQRE